MYKQVNFQCGEVLLVNLPHSDYQANIVCADIIVFTKYFMERAKLGLNKLSIYLLIKVCALTFQLSDNIRRLFLFYSRHCDF